MFLTIFHLQMFNKLIIENHLKIRKLEFKLINYLLVSTGQPYETTDPLSAIIFSLQAANILICQPEPASRFRMPLLIN